MVGVVVAISYTLPPAGLGLHRRRLFGTGGLRRTLGPRVIDVVAIEDVAHGVPDAVLGVTDRMPHARGDRVGQERRGYAHGRDREREPVRRDSPSGEAGRVLSGEIDMFASQNLAPERG